MTLQEMFDLAFVGLRAQGFRKSVNPDGSCAFRGANGQKCALGHCIPDEAFAALPRLAGLSEPMTDVVLGFLGMTGDPSFRAACDLQFAHDCADDPADMEARLRAWAATYGVTVPE